MEENFKDIIREIKDSTLDPEETKKYILAIKRLMSKLCEDCTTEEEKQEVLQQYLEEYENDLKFRGNADEIFNGMLMYNAIKRILADSKGNKSSFDTVVREARRAEDEDNKTPLTLRTDSKGAMIAAVRCIMRATGKTKERDIIEAAQAERIAVVKKIKPRIIDIIQSSVKSLEEYGFLDEYIQSSNEELEQLGLSELQYSKRNPIADEQYDENGNLVTDSEDIGVIDTFSTESLEQIPLEDLVMMAAFWESKYFQERLGLSKAMSTIKTLDLWDTILDENDEAIQKLSEERISGALKKDLALTYLARSNSKITWRMRRQYKKFLNEEGMNADAQLEDEVAEVLPEISNVEGAGRDVSLLVSLIIYQLNRKEMKIKRWGVIGDDYEEGLAIAIENRNFRGPLVIGVPEETLRQIFGTEEIELPKYEKEIDETYSSIMSKLYLPINKYFTVQVTEAYKKNPENPLYADLAGKKVKPTTPSGDER